MNKSANPLEFDPRMLGCASTDAPGYYITGADGVIRRIDQDEYIEGLRAAGYEPVLVNTSHGPAIITSEGRMTKEDVEEWITQIRKNIGEAGEGIRYSMTEENWKKYMEQINPFQISPEIVWPQVPGHNPDPYDRLASCLDIHVDTLKNACRTFDVRVAYLRQDFKSLRQDVRDRKIAAGMGALKDSWTGTWPGSWEEVLVHVYCAMEDA